MIIPSAKSNPQNNIKDDDLVCYCFEYTRKNIEADYLGSGYSKIQEKIKTEKAANGCNCEKKNPTGR